ncbi:multicomponent Na+:H+ antiporter subunit A [Catalinimonas alkaloidigena]|uniref:hydrogen gas-evolving membrane-bound hydrogenase subunit E n=1 Tax=Catalinimonas alkaloidigena TaxID=1075417 RepID=UPI0024066BF0|nr:hydrogen gas-evolving membrane-bound hydrogenase subunit E [Catalinimonas alkaloidigena]MDF9795833.1 multicomponent Na+:H+ antiporter subunit A [Catalinimonas alkaloidigena]
MLIAVLTGYVLALTCAVFYKRFPKALGYLSVVGVACISVYFFSLWGEVNESHPLLFTYDWVPSLRVELSFYLDSLSLFFALLITIFGALILLYSTAYMEGDRQANRFFAYMLTFMASMLGLVLSGNLVQLYIFWELTSISSFLLIAYENEEAEARKSALQALVVTAGGGLALLAGLILIGMAAGSYELAEILKLGVQDSPYLTAILILVLLGSFTKSAQFPFHFWLPNAMAAPTPVSAFLHSATMVKAGIFLLLRFQPVLSGVEGWSVTLMIVGSITMVFAALMSFTQFDIKKILAYITVSALGLMVAAIGIGTELALKAAFLYLLVHAFYKGALFLVAGNLDHEAGSKDIRKLGKLASKMPWTATAAIMASLSMAGLPPALGFIAKEKLYEATLHAPELAIFLTTAAFISSMLYVTIALIIAWGIFFSQKNEEAPKSPHAAPWAMWLPPVLMAGAGLAFGFINSDLNKGLLSPAIGNIIGKKSEISLSLWHGFTWVLGLSLITYLAGFVLYRFQNKANQALSFLNREYRIAPENLYFSGLALLHRLSVRVSHGLQNGYLRAYIFTIFSFLVLVSGSTYILQGLFPQEFHLEIPVMAERLYEFVPYVLILLGMYMIFKTRSRLSLLIATSMLGFGVASVFVFFSAPDVSMTQFLVETITLVFFMLILHRLPPKLISISGKKKYGQLALSLVFGLMMCLILLSIHEVPVASAMKEYYLSQSYPKAKGENVVNVILIDFRALDTMGEITVLAITAIGILALSSLNLKEHEK